MLKRYLSIIFTVLLISSTALAQKYTISGTVTSKMNGEKLFGANVYVKDANIGAATNEDGKYSFSVDAGTHTIICSYIGYETVEKTVDVTGDMTLDFGLQEHEFTLNVTVIADRAKERETPVAFTNIPKKEMEQRLGSRDIPMILNTTPSVYATQEGGGAGDARINVRGFNQRNVAIMINGVPVNDMENGWVYWSNWDGVGDATSSIQVQRGLSAVNLATPSIGGTMNIITDPTAQKFGVKFKQEYGSGTFLKSTLTANTGLVDNKWALSATLVRKTGDGVIDKTWTDAWAYYFGASYNINDKNRLELYALGAPQRHGQNRYMQNIAAYDSSYAKDLGYSEADVQAYPEASSGRLYNENWNNVNPSYNGEQYWDGSASKRYDPDFINEIENYYHKPIVNLNWYTQFSSKLSLYTTAYYSGGIGGGSGTYGSMAWDYSGPSRIVNWNKTIANNVASSTGSEGILRNSVNNQWTIGAISKAYYRVTDELKTSFGVDWRTAEIEHFREVRDLLGGNYFIYKGNEFDSPSQYNKVLGDKLDYYETNTVGWFGAYGQAEYTKDKLTAYGMYGWSMVKYSFTDHFHKDANGAEKVLKSDNIPGYQIKGGASYRLNYNFDVFANVGYVSKVPTFDQVIDDVTGTMADNPKTEKFISYEAGLNFRGLGDKLTAKVNYYYTTWKDRANSVLVRNPDNTEAIIFLTGVNELHSGVELSSAYQPTRLFRLDLAGSIGNWKYLDNVSGVYKDYSSGSPTEEKYNYYVKDLKVGDAPQTQLALAASVYPINGMMLQVVYRYYSNYYADWDPFTRTDPTDVGQVWKTPDYSIFDAHFSYNLPFDLKGVNLQLFAHLFNIFDTVYIQDATDNSRYNGIKGAPSHSAQRAEVFLGIPRTFNVGISLNY